MHQLYSRWLQAMDWLTRRALSISQRRFRWGLLVVLGVVSTLGFVIQGDQREDFQSYDQLMRLRFIAPHPDPSIVIVDIDEASLAQMKDQFGRWPWPRDTLAALLAWLEGQGAAAVVFDILFSDTDPLNPMSDAALDMAVKQSSKSYFPVLRLNPLNDSMSQVTSADLLGFADPINPQASPIQLAVVPPVFESMIQTQRLGFHNIYPAADGINRHYTLWEDQTGWRIHSITSRLGLNLGWPQPQEGRQLINYLGKNRSYTKVPFHEIWRISQSRMAKLPDARFKGAVVLIGSTATSLFDVKPTPLAPIAPGVEVLANAMDNLKNDQFIREWPWWSSILTTWIGLLLMGWASAHMREVVLRISVVAIPGLLLMVSYLVLNVLEWHVNLAASASQALLFFSLLTAYRSMRLHYFSGLDVGESNALINSPPCYQWSCLIWPKSAGSSLHPWVDAIAQWSERNHVIQLGAVGLPFERQHGPIWVQLVGDTEDQVLAQQSKLLGLLQNDTNAIQQCESVKVGSGKVDWLAIWDSVIAAKSSGVPNSRN